MPQASIGHLLQLLDSITLDPKMNLVDKAKYISPISDAITKLIQADKAQAQSAGLSPDQQMQIEQAKLQMEQQKADREHQLKQIELQHKMQLAEKDQQHKQALEALQGTVQTANQSQESQAKVNQIQKQNELAIREQNHAEMMARREQSFAQKLEQGKAEPVAGGEAL